MARFGVATGPGMGPAKAILPDGYDEAAVADFFGAKPLGADHPAIPILTDLLNRRATGETDDGAILDDGGAGAKPAHAGGGSTDGKGGGGGKGKNKDTTGGTDTGGTDTGGTDTGGTDTGGTDTGGTDTGGTDTGGTGTGGTGSGGADDPTTSTADYVSGLDTPGGYNIEIVYSGNWTASQKALLEAAAEMISDIVLGDLPSVNGIDDLRISASMTTIDGGGGTWGWGGTSGSRSDSNLPYSGYLKIDSADAGTAEAYGMFQDLVFHEILHAMGFGTKWGSMGLIKDVGGGDLRFIGDKATATYNAQYPEIAANDPNAHLGVPVETDGGSGSAGKHWDEAVFKQDIMSTRLNMNADISDMTIAALEDMGYDTIWVDEFLLT